LGCMKNLYNVDRQRDQQQRRSCTVLDSDMAQER